MKRRSHVLTLAAVATVGIGGMVGDALGEFTNPIVASGADPWAVQWGGQYFYMGTTGGDVKIARSPWLESLSSNTVVAWKPPTGTVYSHNLWAPELHRINDKWYIYFTADDGAGAPGAVAHRMYVLEGNSQDPQGTYTFKGQIGNENLYAIDGTVFTQGGQSYFAWSGFRSTKQVNGQTVDIVGDQSLYIAPMTDPWTVSGNRIKISDPTLSWERGDGTTRGVNEGPQILEHNGDIFLTYSASPYDTQYYAVGALKLTGADPLSASSWTKLANPLFKRGNSVYAPGHASFVQSPDGTQDWIVYHARKTVENSGRDVRIQQFTWDQNGVPTFTAPTPTGQVMVSPSGVPTVTFIPNLSFERGGQGWLDDFHVSGDVGAVANDGVAFGPIANADGLKVGYLGANVAGKIWQDIGPLTRTAYTLSVGLAISDDQATAAAAHPGQFILRLIGTGLFPGGSANEGAVTILGERTIASSELAASSFNYFDLTVENIGAEQIGNWLRVELATPDGLPVAASSWQVKVDLMTLSLPANAALLVPEPTSLGLLSGLAGMLAMRSRRGG